MATYTASHAKSITTVAAQVDTLTLSGAGKTLRVTGRSGSTYTYFTVDSLGNTPATPTTEGDNCYVAGLITVVDYPWNGSGAVIKLINSGIATLTFMLI